MLIASGAAIVGIILFFILKKKKEAVSFKIFFDNILINNMATLTSLQSSVITITPVDRNGNLSQIQAGSLSVVSSNTAIFTVEPFGATYKVVGQSPGTAKLVVTGDADLGAPVKTILTEVDVIVTPELAVGFNIVFAAPVDK